MNNRKRKKNNMPLGVFIAPEYTTTEELVQMSDQLRKVFGTRKFILVNEPMKFIPIKRTPKIKLSRCLK